MLEAFRFLTILPFGKDAHDEQRLASSIRYFPLVGAFLSLILITFCKILDNIFLEPLLSLILVSILAFITGAIHLDGLADTFDALGSRKSKEEILLIMHESTKGTFGVLAIICALLFKITLISLLTSKDLGLFLSLVLSRYSMVFAIYVFPYAREDGKAKIFFTLKRKRDFLFSTLITFIFVFLTLKLLSIAMLFLSLIATFIIGRIIKRTIGGLTGDTLGAICELNEIIVLFFIFIFQ